MDIISLVSKSKNLINSYETGKFFVNGREYFTSIVILPDKIIELEDNNLNDVEHLKKFLTNEVEILLIGTGKTRNALNQVLMSYLVTETNLSFEFMASDAACRTHNILISEDRFVVTYLLII